MRKLSRAESILFTAAASALLALAVMGRLSAKTSPAPFAPASQGLAQRIAVKEANVRRLRALHSMEPQISADALRYKQYFRGKDFSLELERSGLLKELDAISRRSYFRLDVIKVGQVVQHDGWVECFIDIESESPLVTLPRFLDLLQGTRRLLNVSRLKIATSPQKRDVARCSMTLSEAIIVQ